MIRSLFNKAHVGNFPLKISKYYIIDTDGGADDICAILMDNHLKNIFKNSELLGITTLSGNTHIDNVNKNVSIALKILES